MKGNDEPKTITRLTVNGVPLREVPYDSFIVHGDEPLLKGWYYIIHSSYVGGNNARLYKSVRYNGKFYAPDLNGAPEAETDTQKLQAILEVVAGKPWWWFVRVGRIKEILFR